ncbi:hypothetical protein ACFRR7_35410 [Streptomyces sp. NPDC056909]|uniref:hypothetical protein n=1 Tax=Streptomyces sp. NPDC056909 TaxID=3345963 RepID=UPI0036796568
MKQTRRRTGADRRIGDQAHEPEGEFGAGQAATEELRAKAVKARSPTRATPVRRDERARGQDAGQALCTTVVAGTGTGNGVMSPALTRERGQ